MKLLITCISIVILITGCGNGSKDDVFRVATNVWPGYEALHLAQGENLYTKNIDVTAYDSATIVLSKFRKREVDAAALTLDEAILLHDQGFKPLIIAVMDISNGADTLIAKSHIKSLSDLKGSSIGVENSALGSYILNRVLQKAKMGYDDIILVPLEVNRHEEAFKEGIVDAVITFEPVRSALLKAGGVEIFTSKDIPGEIVDVLVVQHDMRSSESIKDLLQGWKKAVMQINQRDANALSLISKRLNQSEEEFIASLEGLTIPSFEESEQLISEGRLKDTITKVSTIMLEKKLIKSPIDTNRILRQ